MPTRRRILGIFAFAAAFAAAPRLRAALPAAAPARLHVVNGWVLTEADLAELQAHAL